MFRRWRRLGINRRLLVNLTTDKAIAGVLLARRGPLLVLANAELLEPGRAHPLRLDGEVLVDVANVDFIQQIPPPAEPIPVRANPSVGIKGP